MIDVLELHRRAVALGIRGRVMIPDPDLITNREGEWIALRRTKAAARRQLAETERCILAAEQARP